MTMTMTIKKAKATLKKITRKYEKEHLSPPKRKLSAKAAKIDAILADADFGCQSRAVREILSTLLGEKLTGGPSEELPEVGGVVLVPTDNLNSHDYVIGKPVVLMENGSDYAINYRGDIGNHLGMERAAVRCATNKEIDRMPRAQIERVLARDVLG